jgi:hypothetical protein
MCIHLKYFFTHVKFRCSTVCSAQCAVCGILIHAVRQCAAVRETVCCSACGSVRLSGSARGSVWLFGGAGVCGSAAVHGGAHGCVRQSANVCGSAPGRVRQCAQWCVAVLAAVCGCPAAVRRCSAVCDSAAVCGCLVVRHCEAVGQCAYFQINLKYVRTYSYKLFGINQII